jgi:hypothetical protein
MKNHRKTLTLCNFFKKTPYNLYFFYYAIPIFVINYFQIPAIIQLFTAIFHCLLAIIAMTTNNNKAFVSKVILKKH